MSIDTLRNLLREFGASIGLPDLAPDDDGYCALSFDEMAVHLQYDPEDEDLAVFTNLGSVEEERTEEIYEVLLSANLFWAGTKGATLSVQPEDRLVFLANRRPIRLFDQEAFQKWLGDFVDIAEYWSRGLRRMNAGGALEEEDDDGAPGDRSGPTGFEQIIRA